MQGLLLGILLLFLCGPPWIHAFPIPLHQRRHQQSFCLLAASKPDSSSLQALLHELNQRQIRYPPTATKQELWELLLLESNSTSLVQELQEDDADIRLQDLLHELNQRQIRYPPTATKQELWELLFMLESNSTIVEEQEQEDVEDADDISEEQLKQQIMKEIQSSIQMEKQVPDTEKPKSRKRETIRQEQQSRPDTIPELWNQLDALGISYPRRGTRQQLQDLLLQHHAQTMEESTTTTTRRRCRRPPEDTDEEDPILDDRRRRQRPPLGSRRRRRPRPQVRKNRLQSLWQSLASPKVQRISARAVKLAQRQARQVYDWWMEEDEEDDDDEVEEEPPRYVPAEPVSINVPSQDIKATTRYTYAKRRLVDQPLYTGQRNTSTGNKPRRPPPQAAAMMDDQVSKQQGQRPIQDILQELRSRDISFSPTSTRADLEQALATPLEEGGGGKVIIDVVAEPVVVPKARKPSPQSATTPQARRNARSTFPRRQPRRNPRTATASNRQPRPTDTNVPRLLPQRPQRRRRPKKVYSMYSNDDDEDNDEILIKDAWEELGSRASDYVDRFLWGGQDDEQNDSTRRRPQIKRRKEHEKDNDVPIQNQKKRHWKDRMEQSFDKALGIDPPPEGYRRWSEQDIREAQEQGRDAVSVAQGRAPKRRYYEKAPWQDSDSLLGMLFGPTEKKKRKRSKSSMNPFEERASRWDSEGSLSLLCKAIVRSIVPTVGAIAEWAGVRDTIPRPLVVAGVVAGILSSRPGKRLQNTLFLLLGIRLVAEFFHGYMYNDLDFAEDIEEEDTEEDTATPKTNQDPYPA